VTNISIKHQFNPFVIIDAEDVFEVERQQYSFPVLEYRVFEHRFDRSPPEVEQRIKVGDIITFPDLEVIDGTLR
jgi:hypothetical protein